VITAPPHTKTDIRRYERSGILTLNGISPGRSSSRTVAVHSQGLGG
jgi:hypothetical protein